MTEFYISAFLRLNLSNKIIPIVYSFNQRDKQIFRYQSKMLQMENAKINENKNYITAPRFSIQKQSFEK